MIWIFDFFTSKYRKGINNYLVSIIKLKILSSHQAVISKLMIKSPKRKESTQMRFETLKILFEIQES